ncbi:hypothetical protein C5E45_07025 [Nocardia nova]|uniref:Probable 2-phosphosulfolactate phosphatase n=1 Tax=Nocardia nova TaxID=37330 RepID=A0A2S6ATS5_9NOCA|nr:hypothetical protein C5E45_07025 [Nocardia nova]
MTADLGNRRCHEAVTTSVATHLVRANRSSGGAPSSWFRTGPPSEELNGVLRAGSAIPHEIEQLRALFDGVPACWHFWPNVDSPEIPELLHQPGGLADSPGRAHYQWVNAGVYRQQGYRIRLEWGREGVEQLGPECGALIIVDVLSFSTSVDIAVSRGGRVLPLPLRHADPRAALEAERAGAVLAAAKHERGWSLSPSSLLELPAGTLLALPSPNGATLSARAAGFDLTVFAGSLRNADAVAKAAIAAADDRPVGIVAAGERWGVVDGPLRPSLEDYVGAGAIAAALLAHNADGSPEAQVAALGFRAVAGELLAILAGAVSGRELTGIGLAHDVRLAAQWNASTAAPVLIDGIYDG